MTRKEYNRCVEEHADGLYRFILKNIRDEEKARDIVQESFVKVWQKVEEVQFEKGKSYLYTTAYRTMIDELRKDKRTDRLEDYMMHRESSFNSYSDVQEVLEEALKQLPEIQRTVVMLRDYEGYAYGEIGEITNLSESQVKVYIFRARMSLKNYLQKIDNLIETN